jgi:hypothetical protein
MIPTEQRLQIFANGYDVRPAIGKKVLLNGWPTLQVTPETIREWERHPEWTNTSGLTTRTPGCDVDITDPAVAAAVEELACERYGDRGALPVRFGLAPKRCILFRTDTPFAKRRMDYLAPNGEKQHIEVLCDGQQVVLFGIHPVTRKPYTWHAGRSPLTVPRNELASVSESEVDELLVATDELLVGQFGYTRVASPGPDGIPRSSTRVTDVDAALASLCYAGQGGGGNVHDTSLGCINALIVQDSSTEVAVEEVLTAIRIYAATNPLCAKWNWERERRRLEEMAYSFINQFPDYADRLPADLYAVRRVRRGQGVADPQLVYDRASKLWHYPEPLQEAPRSGANENGKAPPEQKFRLIPFGQLRPGNDPGYLVDELIPLRGIVLIWGKRKCLKSFWTYDLCFHIAHCTEYRGRTIQSGGVVVYCAFEGAHGYKKRAEALRRYRQVPNGAEVPLYLVPGRANMIKEYPLLIAAVREQLMGELPRAIVLDTLNKSLVGSESKDVDMAAYIVAAEALRDAFDCVVIIIHHCGYDESHPRGHTSLTGAVDAEFEVVREGMLVTVKNVTMRDGPEGFEIRSVAEIIEVGQDINGKTLSSLVITQTDAPAAVGKKRKGRPNVATPILVDALRAALAERGGPFRPPDGRAVEHVVGEREVRARFDAGYPAGEADAAKAADATAEAYRRALHGAVADGVVGKGVRGPDVVLWFKAPTG